MNLLSLSTARVSLEFAPNEFAALRAALRVAARRSGRPANVVRTVGVTHDLLTVGFEEFVLMTDDGEPCLVSQSPSGDNLLRATVAALSRRQRRTSPAERGRMVATG